MTVQQSVGRIMRPAQGKRDALVLDLADIWVPACRGQFSARKRVYKELGATFEKQKKENER